MVGTRQKEGTTHSIDLCTSHSKVLKISNKSSDASWTQWYQRLAHMNMDDVKRLSTMSIGIDPSKADALEKQEPPKIICESCAIGKQHRTPVRIPRTRATYVGQIVHADLAGGWIITRTTGGTLYVTAMTDGYSDFTTVYLLKKKSELTTVLSDYIAFMKNRKTPIQTFRSDNGGEFIGYLPKRLMKNERIVWDPTVPFNPNQNGVAERKYRTLFERTRAILHYSKLPRHLWGEAISYVCYLKNRSPTRNLEGKTPYEVWEGKPPDITNLRIFGCIAYHYNADPARKKLDDRSIKCRFLGIQGRNQSRLWDPDAKKGTVTMNLASG